MKGNICNSLKIVVWGQWGKSSVASPLALSQRPLQLIPSGDGATVPHPGPCQTTPLTGDVWREVCRLSTNLNPPIDLALADGKWGQRALGAACSIAATPLPAQGLWGELSEIQQPTGGTWVCREEKNSSCVLLTASSCWLQSSVSWGKPTDIPRVSNVLYNLLGWKGWLQLYTLHFRLGIEPHGFGT